MQDEAAPKPAAYDAAGVNVDEAGSLVEYIRKRAPAIGGFAGLFPLKVGGKQLDLVATTDGVGTKLKLAFMLDRHDTVGIDLVAMCVNDLVCTGATPLFFLDYFATGKLDPARARKVIDGVMEGCRIGRVKLLGGETAEMPGFYPEGEYDLAGFAVGTVTKAQRLDAKNVKAGDVLLGFPSTGVHSNGFSLVRHALPHDQLRRLGPMLLTPTRIYVDECARLRKAIGRGLKGLAHITGEGLEGNVPRVVRRGLRVVVDRSTIEVPGVFRVIQKAGSVTEVDMWRTFNMGIGMVAIVSEDAVPRARKACKDLVVIGHVEKGNTEFEWSVG